MEFLRIIHKKYIAAEQTKQLQPKCSNRLAPVQALSGYSWLIILLGLFLIGSLWLSVQQQISYDYDRTIKETSQETMNLAKAFEEHVRKVVVEVDKDLLNLKQAYERYGLSSPVFDAYAQSAAEDPTRSLVAIYNEQGVVVQSLIRNTLGVNRLDREYFMAHRDADSHMLYIGRPIIGKTSGENTISLTRRIDKPNGSFGGIVYIGQRPDYFLNFYQKMDLGKDSLISLVGIDGFVLARQTGTQLDAGQDVREGEAWKGTQAGRPADTYIAINVLDGINRIVSYRAMPDYPLIISVAKSTEVALAPFEKRKQGYILGTSLASLLILAICCLLLDRAMKQRALNMKLKSTLRELHRNNRRLAEQAQLLESAHDYIIVLSLDSRVVYWNKASEIRYGFTATEVKGQVTHDLLQTQFPIPLDDVMESIFKQGHWEGELIHTCKNGDQITVQSNQTLNRDAAGTPLSILEINHDITEKKKLEAELGRLDRLNLIGEMAASIGHEVRNPLTTVRGYLQLFGNREKYADQKEQFDTMIDELDRANSIITEFLSLAKNKAIELKLGNLNCLLTHLYSLIQADALRFGHSVHLEINDIADILLDEKEIRQLVLNLVRNGQEAILPGGTINIKTSQVDEYVILSVQDNGHGIPEDVFAKLGTPFVTTKDNGTGLGLPVCYRIAERHSASIKVETSTSGTTFNVCFPIPKENAASVTLPYIQNPNP